MAVAADLHRDFLNPEDIIKYPRQRAFTPDDLRLFFCRAVIVAHKTCLVNAKQSITVKKPIIMANRICTA